MVVIDRERGRPRAGDVFPARWEFERLRSIPARSVVTRAFLVCVPAGTALHRATSRWVACVASSNPGVEPARL